MSEEQRKPTTRTESAILRSQEKLTGENFKQLGEEFTKEFYEGIEEKEGWTAVKVPEKDRVEKEFSIETKPCKVSQIDLSRGRVRVDKPAEEVWKRLVDSNHLMYVDAYYESSRIVDRFDDAHTLVHYIYKMPFPIWKRDFTTLEVCQPDPNNDANFLAISCSVNSLDRVPMDSKKYVRGQLYASGYVVQKHPDRSDACYVVTLTQCDPAGNIPKSILNSDAKSQPTVLLRIKEYLETDKKFYNKKK